MITGVIKAVLNAFLFLLKYLLYAVLIIFVPILLMYCVFFVVQLIKHKKLPRKKSSRDQPPRYSVPFNPFKILLIDFPLRLAKDFFERDPDAFDTYGVHIFSGEQGSGKSMAAVHFIKCILERNPKAKVSSNVNLSFRDSTVSDWRDILSRNNGIYGQVIFLDEIQNWFSSNESRNFPPAMLTEITQQRKQRKCVVGTSQVFGRISKPIREQITLLYKPMTIAGCLTVVRVYKVSLDDEGAVDKMHFLRWYAFVQDDELRNCYDTFEKVERISVKGFQPRGEQLDGKAV